MKFDLVAHIERQRAFSEEVFGPGERYEGIADHIREELDELAESPLDLEEWVDVALLALDGAWRAGHSPEEIAKAIAMKQSKNELRKWPDWRTQDRRKSIKHIKAV